MDDMFPLRTNDKKHKEVNLALVSRPQKANAVETKLTRKADNAAAKQLQDSVDIVPLVKAQSK
jgi:hypothetical protein